jgi:hypothetical protein
MVITGHRPVKWHMLIKYCLQIKCQMPSGGSVTYRRKVKCHQCCLQIYSIRDKKAGIFHYCTSKGNGDFKSSQSPYKESVLTCNTVDLLTWQSHLIENQSRLIRPIVRGSWISPHSHDMLTKQSYPLTTLNLLMHNTPQSAYWKNIQTYRYARTITNCEIEYTSLYYNYLSCLSGHPQSQWTCRVCVSFLVKCTYVTIILLLIILNYLSKYLIMECDGVGTFNSAHKRLLSAMFFYGTNLYHQL